MVILTVLDDLQRERAGQAIRWHNLKRGVMVRTSSSMDREETARFAESLDLLEYHGLIRRKREKVRVPTPSDPFSRKKPTTTVFEEEMIELTVQGREYLRTGHLPRTNVGQPQVTIIGPVGMVGGVNYGTINLTSGLAALTCKTLAELIEDTEMRGVLSQLGEEVEKGEKADKSRLTELYGKARGILSETPRMLLDALVGTVVSRLFGG